MGLDNGIKVYLLRIMRNKIVWEKEDIRLQFLEGIEILIQDWIDRLPNLRDIFQGDEIERLLVDAINYAERDASKNALVHRFIRFVISSGYRDEPKLDEEGNVVLRRNTPVHLAGKKASTWLSLLFQIYNKFDVNLIDESGFTHFHAACLSCCTDVLKKFLELGQDPDCLPEKPNEHDPPIHLALKHRRKAVCELLLSYGANPNFIGQDGLTPLHRICRYHSNADFLELFFKVSKQPLQVDARDKFGNTPLYVALYRKCLKMVEVLLRNGANPNLTGQDGLTPLHRICRYHSNTDFAELFFKVSKQPLQVDARDKFGNTPLHVAVHRKFLNMIIILLRRGADPSLANKRGVTPLLLMVKGRDASGRTLLHVVMDLGSLYFMGYLLTKGTDPNAANKDGETPLHLVSRYAYLNYVAKNFFQICEARKLTLKLDAKNKRGWTPLYLALNSGSRFIAELLLAKGADPNLANDDGETPLHLICSQGDDQTAKMFFDICDEKKRTVRLDAKDNLGRTPLGYAVSKFEVRLVDLLLERGADVSSLVFPAVHEISEQLNDLPAALRVLYPPDFQSKWRRGSRVATVVESLAKKGYAFDVSQVLSIMRALIRRGLLGISVSPVKRLLTLRFLYSSSEFTVKAKEIMMTSSLSMYDLLKLRPVETKKLLTSAHYFRVADSGDLELLRTKRLVQICVVLLCEMMMERFFKQLALVPFLALTRYRLPISHCEIILEKLPNADLFKLCLLAEQWSELRKSM